MPNYKVGQRVMVYPYWDRDFSYIGTITDWFSNGVYTIELEHGGSVFSTENCMCAYP